MYFYDWILLNKETLKVLYGAVIGLICAVIVLRTDRLFRLSLHQGIRYFRNAFFFFGIGFIIRYFLSPLDFSGREGIIYHSLANFLFEYFLVMAGFFLLYSLLWKRLEGKGENYFSSLFNFRILVFHIMAILIVILDTVWRSYLFMFSSQIIIFTITCAISLVNYAENGSKHKFLKFYFLAMLLSLVAWVLNALIALALNWHKVVLTDIYIINLLIFLLFLYGVVKLTRKIN